ncbi:BREX-1 system adenine-specific DNA-methyltransferase PglX [Candidatus Laterigemmans baculatus]|uniref:BREX-1 system adenine-specific DNA-methyltransferase PglX n=1 Tax=Candidatus Laterigemmans baculatus TaxID=2770505 RepID=UPI0013DD0EEB|nr:BREX-1 system adenine-specific DNA-methyltransferase PglX [Candidatus Laterigemmans baculatus]
MNCNILKKYAPQARREFLQAVTDRASYYGLTKKKTEPVTVQGDTALIGGRAFPKKVADQRKRLEERIARRGFDQVMEAVAYTWFNRLVAIRFMELHGYLEHGYRVLSHPSGGGTPEILEHADSADLPGLDSQQVIDLKLAGDRDAELYRTLLIAQCNALHSAMPFLFERIDDETELLLPDNLLHSDSLIRTLVSEIPEEDWREVEIIGWLYQFYISEKKDQVIGKVVKSEDIPAATQLFTPNWIVKYLVQNSLGRQWVATYPNSRLKGEMEYYIEPAEQTPEVQEQLKAITPDSLDPEELTLLDPACGSGHILVEAYDLLKAIYQERGYSKKDIPRLILTKNLYGLEIDDRAAQLAAFALMMKARADDRRIFTQGIPPHVLSIQESKGLDVKEITEALNAPLGGNGANGDISQTDVVHLIELFEHGKTLGSLIQVPEKLAEKLPAIAQRVEDVIAHGGMLEQPSARSLKPLVEQVRLLVLRYNAVVMNPPYMGGRSGMNSILKDYVENTFPLGKADLFGAFIERGSWFTGTTGTLAMITMESWMFLPSFKELRPFLLEAFAPSSMLHLGPRAFDTISGEIVRTTAFSLLKSTVGNMNGVYRRLVRGKSEEQKRQLLKDESTLFSFFASDFCRVPESRWAYWLSNAVLACFDKGEDLESVAPVRQGFQTGNNDYFMRYWHEVVADKLKLDAKRKEDVFDSGKKWVPYNKGGDFRKWYGNNEYVVAFDFEHYEMLLVSGNCLPSRHLYFQESVTWSAMGGTFGARLSPEGFTFSAKGACAFPNQRSAAFVIGLLNSKVSWAMFEFLAPTLDFNVGSIRQIPLVSLAATTAAEVEAASNELIELARQDWDSHEESWDFRGPCLLALGGRLVEAAFESWSQRASQAIQTSCELETKINSLLLAAYGLDTEMSPEVPEDQITLCRPDQEQDIQRLISYAIGCMMGRFSLDKPGLIYANSSGEGFDPSQYPTFPADSDGIIPITEFEWFEDDAANRLEDFIATAWPHDHLEENLKFIAESIGQKKSESARDAIRRYLSIGFYKQHLSLYKKRPIYWLFSSGKERAFQCLVYLHRYNAGTLSRMRTEYVIPLQGKVESRIDQLELDIEAASSTSHQKRLAKERDALVKHREELQSFDEKLRHHADRRISLELDEGVKSNYRRFGDLLAEVKAVTGCPPEEIEVVESKKKGHEAMRIRNVSVKNFKSLVDFDIELAPFTCLIGLNGSGKTSVLQFLDFLAAQANGTVTDWLQDHQWEAKDLKSKFSRKNNIEFVVTLAGEGSETEARWEGTFNPQTLNCTSETLTIGGSAIEVRGGRYSVTSEKQERKEARATDITFTYEGSILSALKESALPPAVSECRKALRGIKSLELLSPDEMRQRTKGGRTSIGRGGRGLSAVLHEVGPTTREKIAGQLQSIYKQLSRIESRSLQSGLTQLEITEAFGNSEVNIEAFHINDGILRLIAILAELQAERHVLLFDEIENGINPEIVEFLVDTLVAAEQQIVITTHNPMVLNYLHDDVAFQGVMYVYRNRLGHSKAVPFFRIPSLQEKLTMMGPGEVFIDTDLPALLTEIEESVEGK